jgi:hypothetical protein
MRQIPNVEGWVVYEAVLGSDTGRRWVCQQSEWEAIELRRPGLNKLIQRGITSETDAEKLARGTSGDVQKRRSRSDRAKP